MVPENAVLGELLGGADDRVTGLSVPFQHPAYRNNHLIFSALPALGPQDQSVTLNPLNRPPDALRGGKPSLF